MTELYFARCMDQLLKHPNQEFAKLLVPLMERSVRYIYESYGDRDDEVVQAVNDTAENMRDANLYHLPFPVVWLEDPWSPGALVRGWAEEKKISLEEARRQMGDGLSIIAKGRQMYLMYEEATRIVFYTIEVTTSRTGKLQYTFYTIPLYVELGEGRTPIPVSKVRDSPYHPVEQFIVTLNTRQASLVHVPGEPWKRKQPLSTRCYDHNVLRIKVGDREYGHGGHEYGTGRPLHLVTGYIWGKNTRPVEEQKWIEPYWRGDKSLGVIQRTHREVSNQH